MSDPRYVVTGEYFDRSGSSEEVYGPYAEALARTIAKDLTTGGWKSMTWSAVPIGRLPGEVANRATYECVACGTLVAPKRAPRPGETVYCAEPECKREQQRRNQAALRQRRAADA